MPGIGVLLVSDQEYSVHLPPLGPVHWECGRILEYLDCAYWVGCNSLPCVV